MFDVVAEGSLVDPIKNTDILYSHYRSNYNVKVLKIHTF